MKTVLLLGELGKKFGRKLLLDVKTPAEAVRALCANFPEFEQHLIESGKRNVGYRILLGKNDIPLDDIHNPAGSSTIKFVPVIQGAGGSGFTTVLIGAAIIGAAFFTGGASLTFGMMGGITGVSTTFLGGIALGVGASLVLSGVSQMISPMRQSDMSSSERPENQPSYVFNGAVNTTAQGQPVPIGYGRMVVGSAVISAGITTEEIPI